MNKLRVLIPVLLLSAQAGWAEPVRGETAPAKGVSPVRAPTSDAYWNNRERGWHWYEDPPAEVKAEKPSSAEAATPTELAKPVDRQERPKQAELAQFERMQRRLEELEHIAYITPSEENVRQYLALKSEVVERASRFADVWQRVVWATPELDPTVTGRPVNAKALEVFRDEERRSRDQTIASLASTHAHFFFFRSDCPYCHQFAPLLKQFQAKYGINIVPISMDGGALPEFPSPRMDNGISAKLNVERWPALFLFDAAAAKITPIGFGVLAESELIERLYTVTRPDADSMVPGVSKTLTIN
jgi:conjugal transfer pilus assembly protein TraF